MLGSPIIRTLVCGGLYWGPLFWGKLPVYRMEEIIDNLILCQDKSRRECDIRMLCFCGVCRRGMI